MVIQNSFVMHCTNCFIYLFIHLIFEVDVDENCNANCIILSCDTLLLLLLLNLCKTNSQFLGATDLIIVIYKKNVTLLYRGKIREPLFFLVIIVNYNNPTNGIWFGKLYNMSLISFGLDLFKIPFSGLFFVVKLLK